MRGDPAIRTTRILFALGLPLVAQYPKRDLFARDGSTLMVGGDGLRVNRGVGFDQILGLMHAHIIFAGVDVYRRASADLLARGIGDIGLNLDALRALKVFIFWDLKIDL